MPSFSAWLRRLDAWMAGHPWHPRLFPFAVYCAFLLPIDLARSHLPAAYAPLYVLQCTVVVALLWRYRKLLPELTLAFHWSVIPSALVLTYAWVWLNHVMAQAPDFTALRAQGLGRFTADLNQWMLHPPAVDAQWRSPTNYADSEAQSFFQLMPATVAWVSLALRLVGMSLVVPMFEELFTRSLILRSFLHPRPTAIGLVQAAHDMPLLGDLVQRHRLGWRAQAHPPVFGDQFNKNALGEITWFGVAFSTGVFLLSHHPRDWPGCVACGVVWCLMLRWTRTKGLGPIIWSHGLVNALLWAYTLHTGDWRFL